MSKRLKNCFRGSQFTTRRPLLSGDLGTSVHFLSAIFRVVAPQLTERLDCGPRFSLRSLQMKVDDCTKETLAVR